MEEWFLILALISAGCYSIIALAIYFNKELQVHPMKLIMYISLADAALCFNLFSSYKICDLSLP